MRTMMQEEAIHPDIIAKLWQAYSEYSLLTALRGSGELTPWIHRLSQVRRRISLASNVEEPSSSSAWSPSPSARL